MFLNLLLAVAIGTEIKEGIPCSGTVPSPGSEKVVFEYVHNSDLESDLIVTAMIFSDNINPSLYFSNSSDISTTNYQFTKPFRSSGTLLIPSQFLIQNSSYYLLLYCDNTCLFTITLVAKSPVVLNNGVPATFLVDFDKGFNFSFSFVNQEKFVFISMEYVGLCDMQVFVAQNLDEPVELDFVSNGLAEFLWTGVEEEFIVKVQAEKNSRFTVTALNSGNSSVQLQASNTVKSHVRPDEYKSFFIEVDEKFEVFEVFLTQFSGYSTLYISITEQPNKHAFDYSTQSPSTNYFTLSKPDLASKNFVSGKIFISILGVTDSLFTISVRLNKNSSVELQPGIPQESTVPKSDSLNFYLSIHPDQKNLSVYLTTFTGDTEIYFKFCESHCILSTSTLPDSSIYKGQGTSVSQYFSFHNSIPAINCNSSSMCNLAVLVHAKSPSHITLVAIIDDNKISLQQGKAFIVNSLEDSKQYFVYGLSSPSTTELEFTLTPVYGDIFMCTSRDHQDSGSCEKVSKDNGISSMQVKYSSNNNDLVNGDYYITIICQSNCYYSILARELVNGKNSLIHLISGMPQNDVLSKDSEKDYNIYYFQVGSEKTDLEIVFTSFFCEYSVFITNKITTLDWNDSNFKYDWEFSDSRLVKISQNDPNYKTDSTYSVLVKANKYPTSNSAVYTIQYTRKNDIFTLIPDVSIPGQLQSNGFSYYLFPIQQLYLDLEISLNVASGDPDLIISFDPSKTHPSHLENSILSKTFGSETMTLLWDSQISKLCPKLNNENANTNPSECIMYISIYSEYPSSYTIQISAKDNLPKFIGNGAVVHGGLKRNEYKFYYSYVDVDKDLGILLQNLDGESEVFVSVKDKKEAGEEIKDWERPSEGNCLVKTKDLIIENVQLSETQLRKYCNVTCLVLITVKCLTEDCVYSLDNIEESIIKLAEGQPHYGISENEFEYYQYDCDKADKPLIIALTPLESCKPVMFVSKGKENRPTNLIYDWTSETSPGTSVEIASNDPKFSSDSMIGTYNIAVFSNSTACTFTITVTNHEIPVIILTPGLPQQGSLLSNKIKYYTLFNTLAENIVFSLTPSIGSPYLLLSVHYNDGSLIYSDLPTPDFYIWNSNFAEDKYTLKVTSEDLHYCTNCYYLLGVVSDAESSYTITGNTELNVKILQDGVPYKAGIKPGIWQVYRFSLNSVQKIQISVAEYSNQVDFYISINKDLTGIVWKEVVGDRTKTLSISPDDPNFILGTYYVVVTTNKPNTIYSIIRHSKNSLISLVDGWPLMFNSGATVGNAIKFEFNQPGSVFCMVESLTPNYFPIVQSLVQNTNFNEQKSYKLFTQSDYTGEHLSMDFQVDAPNYLILLIENLDMSDTKLNEFSLYCTKSFHPAMLSIGRPAIGMLSQAKPALRYEINLSEIKDLAIYIVPCEGGVELQASTNWTVLKDENPFLTSIKLTNGVIVGKISNIIGKVFLTVKKLTASESATYKIYVDDRMLRRVYPGNSGFLNLDYQSDKAAIKWSGLEYSDGSKFEGNVTYSVFFTEEFLVPLQSTCQVYFASSHKLGEWLGSTDKENFIGSVKENGYLTVIGRVGKEGIVALRDVVYEKIQIEGSEKRGKFGRNMFWLSICTIALFIVVMFLLFKYKRAVEVVNILETQGKQITVNDDSTVNEIKNKEL